MGIDNIINSIKDDNIAEPFCRRVCSCVLL